jgi:hypothetical protein
MPSLAAAPDAPDAPDEDGRNLDERLCDPLLQASWVYLYSSWRRHQT